MSLHPSLEPALGLLRAELAKRGIQLAILETVRSPERQAQLYAQGRTAGGKIVTYAKPYESPHQWGLAVDVKPIPDTAANWREVRHQATRIGWGLLGEWDPGHLQHPAWPRVLAEIRRRWPR